MIDKKTKTPVPGGAVMGAFVFGAIVGGTGAAARGIREAREGRKTNRDVALDVTREAGATAVAAGAATAVVGALGMGPVLSTLGIVAVATGTKYAMDSLLTLSDTTSPAEPQVTVRATPAPAPTAPKKAPAKKVAAKKTAPKKPAAKAAPKKKPEAQTDGDNK